MQTPSLLYMNSIYEMLHIMISLTLPHQDLDPK